MKKLHTLLRSHNSQLDQYRSRLYGRLFVVLIFVLQIALRIYFLAREDETSKQTIALYKATIPLLVILVLIVLSEHVIYKRIGSKSLKYTNLIDALFFIFFTAEWLTSLFASLTSSINVGPMCLDILVVFEFTSFGWRTLLQTLIVRVWHVKVIAPIITLCIAIIYCADQRPELSSYISFFGVTQIIYIIFIFYYENKVNFNLVLTNVQQEKWMKINEFILNNLPENIVILDLEGEVRYSTDHFKSFCRRCRCNEDPQKLFNEIKDLQRRFEADSFNLPLLTLRTKPSLPVPPTARHTLSENETAFERLESLKEVITNFKSLIVSGGIQEKNFLIFNARCSTELEDKSIEIKMSFIHQSSRQYIILMIRDMTQRDLLVAAENNNKYKDKLLASVSHELRTPLNGNINLVEAAIHSDEVPENIKTNMLTPALRSSKFLLHLINDILDQSQIQARKLRLIFRYENLKRTLINTVQLLELQAKTRGIKLEVVFDSRLPKNFCTDHVRLSQIVLNLVNNSIKFTQEGFVRVIAAPIENMPYIEISVQDSGIGMNQEDVGRLFSVFTHIEFQGRAAMNPTGVGLGLSIANNLAELLGPKDNTAISVSSVPNEGSTFTFLLESKEEYLDAKLQQKAGQIGNDDNQDDYLFIPEELYIEETLELKELIPLSMRSVTKQSAGPGSRSLLKTASSARSPYHVKTCECPKVLVVDDDLFNILAFESILNSLKVKFECVYNGRNAIDKIIARNRSFCPKGCRSYKVIFMDQEMPGLSGTETVQELRNLQSKNLLPNMKIVGCTAHHHGEDIDRFLKAGINQCIEKPISKDVIKDILHRYSV